MTAKCSLACDKPQKCCCGERFSIWLCSFYNFTVCKILATELESRLDETGKTHEVLELGYSVDDVKPKRKTMYKKS
jgi:hypothetical protein